MWHHHLGKSVLDAIKEDQIKKFIAEKEKAYLKIKSESDALIATGKVINQFNQNELMHIVKSIKCAGDKALPIKKNDLIKLLKCWVARQ